MRNGGNNIKGWAAITEIAKRLQELGEKVQEEAATSSDGKVTLTDVIDVLGSKGVGHVSVNFGTAQRADEQSDPSPVDERSEEAPPTKTAKLVDIHDTEEAVIVIVELPGLKETTVAVSRDGQTLSVLRVNGEAISSDIELPDRDYFDDPISILTNGILEVTLKAKARNNP